MADVEALCQRSAGDLFLRFTKLCHLNEMKNLTNGSKLPVVEKTGLFIKSGKGFYDYSDAFSEGTLDEAVQRRDTEIRESPE
jgi:hypothetical protein